MIYAAYVGLNQPISTNNVINQSSTFSCRAKIHYDMPNFSTFKLNSSKHYPPPVCPVSLGNTSRYGCQILLKCCFIWTLNILLMATYLTSCQNTEVKVLRYMQKVSTLTSTSRCYMQKTCKDRNSMVLVLQYRSSPSIISLI